MIIDSLSPDKDIEAQRGTGPSMSGAQAALVDPSTSTSASGPMNHPYDYARADDTANEGDRLLEDTSDSLPGTYPASNPLPTPGPQFQEPLGPPPEFTPYEAEWFEVGQGDVVSHDEHLNTDGESTSQQLPPINYANNMSQAKHYTGSSSRKPPNGPQVTEFTVKAHTMKRVIASSRAMIMALIIMVTIIIMDIQTHAQNHTPNA